MQWFVDAEDLLSAIDEEHDKEENEDVKRGLNLAKHCVKCATNPLQAQDIIQMSWISVKDKLPDETGTYLVNVHEAHENGDIGESADLVLEAWYEVNGLMFIPKSVGWHMLNEFYEFSDQMRDEITHWMPFPAPPMSNGVIDDSVSDGVPF